METKGERCFSPEGDFNTPICEDDLNDEEQLPYHQFSQDRLQQASKFSLVRGKWFRPAAVTLAILAAVLLIVNIALGVHYYRLKHSQQTMNNIEHINIEMTKLQETYKAAFKNMSNVKKNLDSDVSREVEAKWEFDHQTRRSQDYKKQLDKATLDVTKLKSKAKMVAGGCRHCPPGWILMNAVCFFFSLLESDGNKNWPEARDFCQIQGGDLVVLDTKDKQNSTVTYLRNYQDLSKSMAFWIGLSDSEDEGTWKWVNGRFLTEGYWEDGQPNGGSKQDCATLSAEENFFNAWNDIKCGITRKWICEKSPTQ